MQVSVLRPLVLVAAVLAAAAAAAIAFNLFPQDSAVETGRGGNVVVSTALIGEIVYRLTDGRVPVRVLLPPGAEIHDWEPSAKEVSEVSRATLVIYLTDALEGWMRDLIASSGYRGPIVVLERAPGVETIPLSGMEEDHMHGDIDPHLWLSLRNYVAFVRNIAESLRALYPELREVIDRNEATLVGRTDSLLAEYRERLKPYAGRAFLTEHLAFRYLARDFGLTNVAVKGVEEQEPDPRHLVELRSVVEEQGIKAIYVDNPSAVSKTVESFARELGLKVLRLDTMESMTLEEAISGRGYLERMRENLQALLEGFEA
ncbi:MAG: zinc ABC transporter substrate-binding protein [Nitrososphaerota archaeon]